MSFRSSFLAFGLVLVGCSQVKPPLEVVEPTLDDQFVEIANKVPGFGGMFVDENQKLNVYLLDKDQKSLALQAIDASLDMKASATDDTIVRLAKYDFRDLDKWNKQLTSLLNLNGVNMTDINEVKNRLSVGVNSKEALLNVEKELTNLGIPRSAVDIAITTPVVQLSSLQDRVRPLMGGLQINFPGFYCTYGFNAVRAGVKGFVTNSHCTSKQGGVDNTPYWQQFEGDGNFIGTELVDPTYSWVKCPLSIWLYGRVCRYSDSAFVKLDAGVTSNIGQISKVADLGSLDIVGNYRITGEKAGLVGETVNKVGRTSGWTQGKIVYTCVNTNVSGSRITQLCQNYAEAGVIPGDSGSPVFEVVSGDDVKLHGILWGGSGSNFVYSPIANVKRSAELGSMTTF